MPRKETPYIPGPRTVAFRAPASLTAAMHADRRPGETMTTQALRLLRVALAADGDAQAREFLAFVRERLQEIDEAHG
jgi:hypothetical protein